MITNTLTRAFCVYSSVINSREEINCFRNFSLTSSIVESLNTLTRRIKASPAISFKSVCSKYFTIAPGNLELFRNYETTSSGKCSLSFLTILKKLL